MSLESEREAADERRADEEALHTEAITPEPEITSTPVVEPPPDTIGRRLFKALEDHTPKGEDLNVEDMLKGAQATWSGMIRCPVDDANKFSGWMLVAMCGYSAWYRGRLLTSAQINMLIVIMQDAQAKWRLMHTYSDGSYQLHHDIQRQPVTGRFIEGAEGDLNQYL